MSDGEVIVTPIGENLLEVESPRSARIRTLDQLLDAAQVDRSVWMVESWKPNAWETSAKIDDEIVVQTLFQVKAYLRRKKLVQVFPHVQPVTVKRASRRYKAPLTSRRDGVEITLILTDPHFGYVRNPDNGALRSMHDMRALDVVLQVSYDLRPHRIVVAGDILDLAEWSDRFVRSPDLEQLTQPAILAAHWWLDTVGASSPGAAKVLLEGNHDKRMELAILNHLKAAYDLRPADEMNLPPALSIPRLLALKKIGYHYIGDYPNGQYWVNDDFVIEHGSLARKGGGKTVSAAVKDYDVSVLFGHIHRIEQAPRTIHTNRPTRTVGAYSPGCLCRIDGTVPGRSARPQWQQGFAVSYHTDDHTQVQLYEIADGRCLFGGKMYHGSDRTDVLEQTIGRKLT